MSLLKQVSVFQLAQFTNVSLPLNALEFTYHIGYMKIMQT